MEKRKGVLDSDLAKTRSEAQGLLGWAGQVRSKRAVRGPKKGALQGARRAAKWLHVNL